YTDFADRSSSKGKATTPRQVYVDYMKQLKGDAESARVSFSAVCCDKTILTFKDTPRLAAGRSIQRSYF
ncbi:MAG: hypothetical protein PVH42_13080, partial [Desulfobacterales bacterium]